MIKEQTTMKQLNSHPCSGPSIPRGMLIQSKKREGLNLYLHLLPKNLKIFRFVLVWFFIIYNVAESDLGTLTEEEKGILDFVALRVIRFTTRMLRFSNFLAAVEKLAERHSLENGSPKTAPKKFPRNWRKDLLT